MLNIDKHLLYGEKKNISHFLVVIYHCKPQMIEYGTINNYKYLTSLCAG